MKSELERQIEKVYVCNSCGRIVRLARHTRRCSQCGGTLTVKTVVEKGK